MRILIVEDDQVDRLACRRAFRAAGSGMFELLEADSGAAGLALVAQQRPAGIVLDYQMPDLNGLEFLSRLDACGLDTPVLMLTGADSATIAADAMRRGARDYMVKDVPGTYLARLPDAVVRMLREHALLLEQRRTEARFRTLVEQIQAISYIAALEPPHALSYISPQIARLGYSAEQWPAEPGLHRSCMDPSERAAAWDAICASRLLATPLSQEYRLHARDGSVFWFRDQAEVVSDEAGLPLFMQGILIDITASKQTEAQLLHSQEALRKLAAHEEAIKEGERKRIAQEIHDELGGLLTGIKAYLSVAITAQGAQAHPLLADAAGLAQDALDTVRRVITDLRPSVLDQLGVWEAIEWCGGQAEQRAGLHWHSQVAASAAACTLGPERCTMLFRIVQEALTNVVRHAQASAVTLEAWTEPGQLLLRLADNGQGLDAARMFSSQSWGILGMQERAGHFGGSVTLSGARDSGTTVLLRLPLESCDA
jgi:two-component system sensor histidine kinase UhpB